MDEFYEFCDIYTWPAGYTIYWPVFRRPGRQRKARRAFDDFTQALKYGFRVEKRYRRWQMRKIKALWWWVVGVGAHVLAMLLGLLTWWLLVGR